MSILTKQPVRLIPPTPAQIETVTDVLEYRWASNAIMVQDRYTQAIERDDHNAASKWALAGAISTDKILVLKGRPTEITGHLHAHRHDIGPLMNKLASALRPVARPAFHSPITRVEVGNEPRHDAPLTPIDAASNVQLADIVVKG